MSIPRVFAVFGLLASVAAISTSAAAQPALNPGMPDLEERYQLTPRWFITLPGKFNRRIEGTVLVFERPGYTMRVSVAANDSKQSKDSRLAALKREVPAAAFDLEELSDARALRLSYRLRGKSEADPVPGFHGFTVGNTGHVRIDIKFDHEAELKTATQILRSVNETPEH